jgi:hypothetical protein
LAGSDWLSQSGGALFFSSHTRTKRQLFPPSPLPAPHKTQHFDHHQKGFAEAFGHGFDTKLSSAGLVYKHYGRGIVADRMGKGEDAPEVKDVWLQVYRSFVEAVRVLYVMFGAVQPPAFFAQLSALALAGFKSLILKHSLESTLNAPPPSQKQPNNQHPQQPPTQKGRRQRQRRQPVRVRQAAALRGQHGAAGARRGAQPGVERPLDGRGLDGGLLKGRRAYGCVVCVCLARAGA